MKCIECRKRKGKRHCPALNRLICTQCCGEKRVIEIHCPPDCPYLASGQSYQWMKKYSALLHEEPDLQKKRLIFQTVQEFAPLVSAIERQIVEYSNQLTSFSDQQALQAIQQLKATYAIEEKGVIFEEASSQPVVQALYQELRKALESHREELSHKGYTLKLRDLQNCLEVIEADIQFHIQRSERDKDYLEFIARSHPGVAKSEEKRIIVPGR